MKKQVSLYLLALAVGQVGCSSNSSQTSSSPKNDSPAAQPKSESKNSDSTVVSEEKKASAPIEEKKPEIPSAEPAFDVAKLLPDGNWIASCKKASNTDLDPLRASSLQVFQFSDERLVKTTTFFDRDDCGKSGEATHLYTTSYSIELGSESTIVAKARVFIETSQQTFLTPLTAAFVSSANSTRLFEMSDWMVQIPKLILSGGDERTDIFKIVDSKLCFGKFEKQDQQTKLVGLDEGSCLSPNKQEGLEGIRITLK